MTLSISEQLKHHPVLGALDQYSLERLLQAARAEQPRRNEALFSVGDRADRVWLLSEGAVKITSVSSSQREVVLDILGAGDLVGDHALTEDRRGNAAATLRETVVISFPATSLRTLWSRNPDFAAAWMHYVTMQRLRIEERATEIAYGNIDQRLIRLLTHLARYHGARTRRGNTVLRFSLTHHEIANLVGATRETTTLAMGRLKAEGLIGFLERKIVLRDRSHTDVGPEERAG